MKYIFNKKKREYEILTNQDEPVFPPIPDVGEVLSRKDRFIQRVKTVIKCKRCKNELIREFKPGDYTFKKIDGEECKKCQKKTPLTIIEIFSEWYDPKKEN